MKTLLIFLFSIFLFGCNDNYYKKPRNIEPSTEQMRSINECIKSTPPPESDSYKVMIIKTCRDTVFGLE